MIIIAFAGVARGGKTTAARCLHSWCLDRNMNPTICSFASPIKKAAAYLGITKEKDPDKYRATLQRWGATRRDPAFRPGVTGPHYWTNKVLAEITSRASEERAVYTKMDRLGFSAEFKETVLIFDDLRYIDELSLIKHIGGTVVFVDGASRISDLLAEWRQHESEALAMSYSFGLLPDEVFDYYIPNRGTEEEFNTTINRVASVWVDSGVMVQS